MTRKQQPVRGALGKGEEERKTDQAEQRWKCTKRTNLYFDKQNNLHDFGRRFRHNEDPEWTEWSVGVRGYSMQMVEKLCWHCETNSKTEVRFFLLLVGQSLLPALGGCFLSFFFFLRHKRKDTGRTKDGRWDEKKKDNAFLYLCLPAWLLCMTVFSASPYLKTRVLEIQKKYI